MNVKELIQKLSEYDENMEVTLANPDGYGFDSDLDQVWTRYRTIGILLPQPITKLVVVVGTGSEGS